MVTTTNTNWDTLFLFLKRLILCAYMWTNGQTKRNKRFQYGKWHLHTSLTPLYGSVMASQPLNVFVGFPLSLPLELWNRQVLACMHSLPHTLPFMYFFLAPPALLSKWFFTISSLTLPQWERGDIRRLTHRTEKHSTAVKNTFTDKLSVLDEGCSNSFFVSLAQFMFFKCVFI